MTWRLALRSLATRPVRTAVLSGGFGFGIAVMATLLGIGDVVLEQARAPERLGGGDLIVGGPTGEVHHARYILSSPPIASPQGRRVQAAAPVRDARLYLVTDRGTRPLAVRGGIPSLEHAVGDPETAAVEGWTDAPADRAWTDPPAAELLREMDRFHPIPAAPRWNGSWAEWLYFNGTRGDSRFYLTFLVGPETSPGMRGAGVHLQLERDGRLESYTERADVSSAVVLAEAPSLRIGRCTVTLTGMRYEIALALDGVSGRLTLDATPSGSMPPFEIHGADGWLTGYTVPVMSGDLAGDLHSDGERVVFDGGTGYHDHNWGHWDGVSWRWGQVAQDDLSLVYGRVLPPADAADADRLPGFLGAIGPDGPLGFSMAATIVEPTSERIEVRAAGASLDLALDLDVLETIRTPMREGFFGGRGVDFIQMRARYHVTGRVGSREVEFTTIGSAETFRSTVADRPSD